MTETETETRIFKGLHDTWELNPETGLPYLPEGMYWRVSESSSSRYIDLGIYHEVTTQKVSRNWYGKKLVSEKTKTHTVMTQPMEKMEISEEKILRTADYILSEKLPSDRTLWINVEDRVKALVGKYPPNSLIEKVNRD